MPCPDLFFACGCLSAPHFARIVAALAYRLARDFSFSHAIDFAADDLLLIDLALREAVGSGDISSQYFLSDHQLASARTVAEPRALFLTCAVVA